MMRSKSIKNNKKQASATIYITFLFVVFLAFSAFAVDGAIVLTDRVKLQNITEASALAAASEFNSTASVSDAATGIFNVLKSERLVSATSVVLVDTDKKQVKISSQYISRPIFLSFLGVTGIRLEAKSCAVSEAVKVKSTYSGVNWVTSSANYISDILSADSSVTMPLGGAKSAAYDSTGTAVKYSYIEANGLSLGPGGYVTIKLPEPLVDKPGNDLYVEEGGSAKEGYMVFAGLDVNPDKPYVKSGTKGDDIYWVNISCSATGSPTSSATTNGLGLQAKVYGNGSFDIGASCAGNLAMVKYIRIVDDNEETAYIGGVKYNIYGEASTATAGADIAPVTVLNHVRLIAPDDYGS